MIMRVVLITPLVLCAVMGQYNGFEQECNILQTLVELQNRLDSTEARLQEQETELRDKGTELDETKRSLADAVTRLQDQDRIITNLKNSFTELSRPSPSKAAFTARLALDISNLGYRQTIVFDDVVTNVNNCYSPTTGIFTANTTGTFFFFVSIMTPNGGHIQTEIVKNGVAVTYTYSYVPTAYDQGANGAVLSLIEGDNVWIRKNDDHGSNIFGYMWCTFSGFQI